MPEEQQTAATEQAAGTPEQAQEQSQPAVKMVPYERLEVVSHQNQELRRRDQEREHEIKELREKISLIQSPGQKLEELERIKAEESQFYQNPFGAVRKIREEVLQEMDKKRQEETAKMTQQQVNVEYQSTLRELRQSPGFTQEIEDAMVEVIRDNDDLRTIHPGRAIQIAYRAATGQKWGTWSDNGYSTKNTKIRLTRPSAGGAPSENMLTEEQYKKIPYEEYRKDQGKYDRAYNAWVQSQQK